MSSLPFMDLPLRYRGPYAPENSRVLSESPIDIGDIVRIDLDKSADKEYWRELSEIDGVVLDRDDTGSLLVRWTKECGLCLHLTEGALKLVSKFRSCSVVINERIKR